MVEVAKRNIILTCALISCLIFVLLSQIQFQRIRNQKLEQDNRELEEVIERFTLCYALEGNQTKKDKLSGLYYNEIVYIWVKDMQYIDALEIFNHEWLHYKERNHFG